ncbi:MAG TPA: hypothetical protein VN611_13980 [Patescibacteria group bacterium]|nr:hypothetical protein [Patescibacteria group bacterium]
MLNKTCFEDYCCYDEYCDYDRKEAKESKESSSFLDDPSNVYLAITLVLMAAVVIGALFAGLPVGGESVADPLLFNF